jgi:endonuclease/exonuclease/phosphatase family metal-dependent hydrolase
VTLAWLLMVAGVCRVVGADPTNVVTLAAYNVENWLSMERGRDPKAPKPVEERAKVVEIIASIRPDVLGVAEMGTRDDLGDLKARLEAKGLAYPHTEWIEGADTTRHVALLSRYPITNRYSRTDYTYELDGRTMRIQRGILDVKVQVNDAYAVRVIMLHLKSKREVDELDQAAMRLEEARLVRQHVAKALKHDPGLNLVVMGDLNDTDRSPAVRAIIGEAPFSLIDLKPVSSNGFFGTHYYRGKKEFSRIDYLLVSPGMTNELVAGSARIAQPKEWYKASDHLAISAQFIAEDRK